MVKIAIATVLFACGSQAANFSVTQRNGKYCFQRPDGRVVMLLGMSHASAGQEVFARVPEGRFRLVDLRDADSLAQAFEGMDVVLHLAAEPEPNAPFESLVENNIAGTHAVLEACRDAAVRRLVYASSVTVSWGYLLYHEPYRAIWEGRMECIPAEMSLIRHTDALYPTDAYGASKAWGEMYCRTYADKHGMSIVCLRIGVVNRENHVKSRGLRSVFLSHRDCLDITIRSLRATEKPLFDVFYAVSNNPCRWMDIDHARDVLGYVPRD